jgi:hypothetical protein
VAVVVLALLVITQLVALVVVEIITTLLVVGELLEKGSMAVQVQELTISGVLLAVVALVR